MGDVGVGHVAFAEVHARRVRRDAFAHDEAVGARRRDVQTSPAGQAGRQAPVASSHRSTAAHRSVHARCGEWPSRRRRARRRPSRSPTPRSTAQRRRARIAPSATRSNASRAHAPTIAETALAGQASRSSARRGSSAGMTERGLRGTRISCASRATWRPARRAIASTSAPCSCATSAILATGYNGSIRRPPHCDEEGLHDGRRPLRAHDPRGGESRSCRRRRTACASRARPSTVTASPCWGCFKLIANAGCVRIVFGEFYRDPRIFQFATELGIELAGPPEQASVR